MAGRHPMDLAVVVRLAEDTLMLVGEEKSFLSEVGQLEVLMAGLEQADMVDEALAVGEAEQAERQARLARAHVADLQARNEQRAKIRGGIMRRFESQKRLLNDVSREIARDASDVGVPHIRPQLLVGTSS